ncbi:ADP-ribosylation factor [Elysia marginata]|uniref:ADP-ribosylation factor n=1 Tax=Elysia marginata TaxID=1093978 RepID=A0AAV4EI42_9GAST|nr:ADP-ribosylation factor [Elysia marginata]
MGNRGTKRNFPENVILLEGLEGSGKTSLLFKLKSEEFDRENEYWGSKRATLDMRGLSITYWDLYGRAKARPVEIFNRWTKGFVYIIDSADLEQLDCALDVLVRDFLLEDKLPGTVVMVLANKQDIPGAMTALEVEGALKQKYKFTSSPASGHTVFVRPCSVKTMSGVEDAFAEFVEQLRLRDSGNAKFGLISLADKENYENAKDVLIGLPETNQHKETSARATVKKFLRNPFCLFSTKNFFKAAH